MTLFNRLARETKESIYGTPAEYELAGKVVTCNHCGHTRFTRTRPFSMIFAVAIFKPATLECENCSSILWFSKPPQPSEKANAENL